MLINGSAIPLIIPPSEFVPYAISYEWSFGDGTNGTGEITNHSFHSPGNYTVSLEVTDSDGEERRCNARDMTIRICSKNP